MKKELQTKEYLEKLKDIKLSESARGRMQEDLLQYARFHSVRVGGDSRSIKQVQQSTSLFNLFKPKSMTAAIIAIMLIAGGGTSYAAQGAVPGEFLYGVKTEVNENIRSAFAVSNASEAKLQAQLAKERLEEAEELAARGQLTTEVASNISTSLNAHTKEATERSVEAEKKGDYESSATVRASLEGSLRAYANILSDLNGRVSGNSGDALIADIQAYADATADAQVNATATIDVSTNLEATAETAIARADNVLLDTKTKLERAESEISAEAYARIEARYDQAVQASVDAKAQLRGGLYREAYTTAQTAVRIASEVDVLITSAVRIEADLDTDVNINVGRPGDPIPGIDITSDENSREETTTETETEVENDTETEDEQERDTKPTLDVEVEATSNTQLNESVVGADAMVDLEMGATNATDYNSSRSNKSY